MKERIFTNRILMLTSISGWLLRITTAGSQLLVIRLVTSRLGIDQYGLFAVVTGLWGWFQLADLGLGNAVLNSITHSDEDSQGKIIYVEIWLTILLSSVFLLIIFILGDDVGRWLLCSSQSSESGERIKLFSLAASIMVLTAVCSVSYKVWYARGNGYIANLIQASGSIGALIFVVTVVNKHNSVPISAVMEAFLLPQLVAAVASLAFLLPYVRIATKSEFIKILRQLIGRTVPFLSISIVAITAVQSDIVIASKLLLPSDIAVYSVVSKIFTLAYFFCTSITMSFWPNLALIIKKQDWPQVVRLMRGYLLLIIGLIASVATVTVLLRQFIGNIFLGLDAPPLGVGMIIIFGAYTFIRAATDFFATAVQASDDLKYAFYLISLQAIVSVISQLVIAYYLGSMGLVIGATLSYILTVSWAFPLRLWRYNHNFTKQKNLCLES